MSFSSFISALSTGLNLVKLSKESKKSKVEALTSIQLAVIKTREHLEAKGYKANTELSKYWLNAFEKAEIANIVNDYYSTQGLFFKAKFWENPQYWLIEKGSMELVPKLKTLELQCDSLIAQLTD